MDTDFFYVSIFIFKKNQLVIEVDNPFDKSCYSWGRTRWYIEMTLETYWMRTIFVTVVVIFFCGISYATKLPKDLSLWKLQFAVWVSFFKNILRYVHFQAMAFLWILIRIKSSIDWSIKHQILRNLNSWWPKNCAFLNLTKTTWLK